MTLEMWIVLIILGVAIFLFVTEWLRVDMVALLVVLALILTGTLTTGEAMSGFSNSSVLTIVFLFVVGGAVMHTGLAAAIGQNILKIAGTEERRLLVVLMVAVAILSGFMSNTGTVAVLLPAVVFLALKAGSSPSKLLIPLSYGSMLGGAMTLIGTPPNLMVNEVLVTANLEPFGFFEFMPMGIVLLVVGTAFMLFVGRHLLPDHKPERKGDMGESAKELASRYGLDKRLRRLHVPTTSALVGQSLAEADLRHEFDIHVLKIMRPSDHVRVSDLGHNINTRRPRDLAIIPEAATTIQAGDNLIVEAPIGSSTAASKHWELELSDPKPKDMKALVSKDVGVAEIVVPPRSRLINRTLEDISFGDVYHLQVLEIHRPPNELPLDINTARFRFGDTLLVQGTWERILALRNHPRDFVTVGNPEGEMGPPHRDKAGIALAILVAMVALMVVGWLPFIGDVSVLTVAIMASVAMVLFGCISMDEAYKAIDWKSVVLIACILPVSIAMQKVGLVDVIANALVNTLGSWGPYAVMIGLFTLTAVFTQVISNTATAVVIAPLALASAQTLGINPYAFMMTVAVAASCAFVTPVASPTNTLVMGAGNYRFGDYARVGIPMLLVCMFASVIVLPILFPF